MVNTSTHPPSLQALARRVVWVLLAASPHLPDGHDGYHDQQPQHQHHMMDDTPPAPSPTSNCSCGGSWVKWQQQQWAAAMREEDDEQCHITHPQGDDNTNNRGHNSNDGLVATGTTRNCHNWANTTWHPPPHAHVRGGGFKNN